MYCPKCGTRNEEESKFCENCGSSLIQEIPQVEDGAALNGAAGDSAVAATTVEQEGDMTYAMISPKDKGTLILLACFGTFGIDRFYRGQTVLGIVKLITLGACGIWTTIDLFSYMIGSLVRDSDNKWIVDRKTLDLMRNAQ